MPWSGVQVLIPSDLILCFPPEMVLSIVDGSAVLCLIVVIFRGWKSVEFVLSRKSSSEICLFKIY